eukprot:727504-Hanusia_phi.AAC.1
MALHSQQLRIPQARRFAQTSLETCSTPVLPPSTNESARLPRGVSRMFADIEQLVKTVAAPARRHPWKTRGAGEFHNEGEEQGGCDGIPR